MELQPQCSNDLYLLLGSTGVSILLFLSEILPFIKNSDGNGILHSIVKMLSPKEIQIQSTIEHPQQHLRQNP